MYVERGGVSGRTLDYWLRAAGELKRPRQMQSSRSSM
jgi:hypothetical protein